MFTFKEKLTDTLIDHLCPIGERYRTIMETDGYVDEVLAQGAEVAEKRA